MEERRRRRAARAALAYLPEGARIRAKIYPVIKPRENSFVFDLKGDPAVFLYLDPAVSRGQLENTLAHELHHIGYGGSCPPQQVSDEAAKLPPSRQSALRRFRDGALDRADKRVPGGIQAIDLLALGIDQWEGCGT